LRRSIIKRLEREWKGNVEMRGKIISFSTVVESDIILKH